MTPRLRGSCTAFVMPNRGFPAATANTASPVQSGRLWRSPPQAAVFRRGDAADVDPGGHAPGTSSGAGRPIAPWGDVPYTSGWFLDFGHRHWRFLGPMWPRSATGFPEIPARRSHAQGGSPLPRLRPALCHFPGTSAPRAKHNPQGALPGLPTPGYDIGDTQKALPGRPRRHGPIPIPSMGLIKSLREHRYDASRFVEEGARSFGKRPETSWGRVRFGPGAA